MTANVDATRIAAKPTEAGMDGYVTKPIRIPDLVGALLETPPTPEADQGSSVASRT